MPNRTVTPESGASRIEPHYRLTEPLENRLADARALLALLGDISMPAADDQRISLTADGFCAAMRIIHGLLPDTQQMAYVPSQRLEV